MDFMFRNVIVRGEEFGRRVYTRALVRFSSFIRVNLAYVKIDGGSFVGNGWERCNLFGMQLSEAQVERDQFIYCSMGSSKWKRTTLEGVEFCETACTGSIWREVTMENCHFQKCNLRGMCFRDSVMEQVVFLECIFDDTDMEKVRMSGVLFIDCMFQGKQKLPQTGYQLKNCRFER